jgi:hypothetical protein
MIPVQDIYNATYNIIRFSQAGDFSVPEWNTAIKTVEDQLYKQYREKGLMDAETQMNMMPFRGVYAPAYNANGQYTYPSDYFEYIAAACTTGLNQMQIPVAVISDAKWSPLVSSKLIPVANNPILSLADGTMQLQPVTANLNLTYYKTITNAVYGVTYNANFEPIYDSGTSVDSMFMPSLFNTIVDMMVIEIGKSLRDSEIIQDTAQTINA